MTFITPSTGADLLDLLSGQIRFLLIAKRKAFLTEKPFTMKGASQWTS